MGNMAMFSSPDLVEAPYAKQGLHQPHTGAATVPGTGTLQPSSCGKGPTAVRESVRGLPGFLRPTPVRLTGKGSERGPQKTAARVVRARESRVHGQRRQARRAFDFTRVEALQG